MKVKSFKDLREGEVFENWIYNRLFRLNKNVIVCTTGGTGSGKSYQDLRRIEIHYKTHFAKKFPDINKRISENICFTLKDLSDRLTSNDLLKGEVLICEEMGVNLNNLDFQSKTAKIFNYVLQSFRSKNIGLFMNLPVFTMMNKSARLLTHFHFVMVGVSRGDKISTSKGKYLQLNQESGKVYSKYLKIKVNGVSRKIKRYNYHLPGKELIEIYEKKKDDFVNEQTKKLNEHLEDKDNRDITFRMKTINYCFHKLGLRNPRDIAKKVGEIEKFEVFTSSINRSMGQLDKKFPKWRESLDIIGIPNL